MYDLIMSMATNGAVLLAETEAVTLYRRPGVIIGPISSLLGSLCDYLFNIVSGVFSSGTLGITIVLFTIVVRILLLPLAAYSAKSMAKMRVIQPEIKKIQEKYKGKTDVEARQRMNAEVSELQRKSGASPLNGCLPTLFQLPIIYALFFILQRVYLYIETIGKLYGDIADLVLQIPDIGPKVTPIAEAIPQIKRFVTKGGFDLAYADNCKEIISKMGQNAWDTLLAGAPQEIVSQLEPLLSQKKNIEYFLGMDLVERPSLFSLSILICILSAVTTYLSTWIMNKAQGQALDEQTKTQQRAMLYSMPLVTGFISFTMPAGIGIYWVMGNIFQIGQQYVFNKLFTVDGVKKTGDDKNANNDKNKKAEKKGKDWW